MQVSYPSRREVLTAAGAASGGILFPDSDILEMSPANAIESVKSEVDVLVIGGGTAGTVAAIQAALAGSRTAILEKGSQLGGTLTTANVNRPGIFHAAGKQVIAGIGWELVAKTVELNSDTLPDFSSPDGRPLFRHQVSINAALYAVLAEEKCIESGVELLYYELPVSVASTSGGWKIVTAGKGIKREITCRQLIDCTGGADIVGMLGLPRLREKEIQPGTLRFILGGYDFNALDKEEIDRRFRDALEKGLLQPGDYRLVNQSFMRFLELHGDNLQHVINADSSTSITQTKTNIEGRKSVLRLLRFIRSLPGCKNARIERLAPETGIRETYRIAGEIMITLEDYLTGRKFDDAVCYSYYPIDLHSTKGIVPMQLKKGAVPTVPLRALIPQKSRNLLIAGRSISSDRLANSALRVQASCMAMGQAAGAAAALAAEMSVTPGEVPLSKLRDTLRENGAVVPV